MNVKSIVVEQIDWDGYSKSLTLEPISYGQLWVAFPTDYEEAREGPFYFQKQTDENQFNTQFAECKARKVSPTNFFRSNKIYTYKTAWYDIPTDGGRVSYYALHLPKFAIPLKIKIVDPFNRDKQYKRTVFKDTQHDCYIIYLSCASKYGKFSFELECIFSNNKTDFGSNSYTDEFQRDFYPESNEWTYFLREQDKEKTQQFFADKIVLNMKQNNPWISGLFYLFMAAVVLSGLAIISNMVHWAIFPIIIIGGILLIGILGALQLRNDDKLKDANFLKLVIETYKSLPLLRSLGKK